MEIEKQVCSLELAKKLKELGVKQESLFFWKPDGGWHLSQKLGQHVISAFTVAELGEILPNYFVSGRINDNYQVEVPFEVPRKYREAKTEADARAKCLIYLIENKLITL